MSDPRFLIVKTLMAQVGLSLALALVVWVWLGAVPGYSVLIGGLICVLPNAFMAARILKPRDDVSGKGMMRAAWSGEIGKLGLTALLFGVVFAFVRPLAFGAVFAGFIAAQLVFFVAFAVGSGAGDTHSDA